MRERIFTLIEKAHPDDKISKVYDYFIVGVSFLSIIPLMFKQQTYMLSMIDLVTVYILFADYVLRWITYDYKCGSKYAFIKYPVTPFAVLDMVSLLPTLGVISGSWRILRMLRIFKVLHYSNNFLYIAKVFKREQKTLLSVLYIALFYIFISALAMFTNEPDTFDSFFEAAYWATTALTTVGYGDVYPKTEVGRLISMISSLFGIAIIALPAGIVTAGFVDEINRSKEAGDEVIYKEHNKLAPEYVRRCFIIMVLCVITNFVLTNVAGILNLPVYLDTTGTIAASMLLEPAAGLLVGLVNNFYLAVSDNDSRFLFYYSISAIVAVVSGLMFKKKKHILAGLVIIILSSSAISTVLSLFISGGAVPYEYWHRVLFDIIMAKGVSEFQSFFLSVLLLEVIDKTITAIITVFPIMIFSNYNHKNNL